MSSKKIIQDFNGSKFEGISVERLFNIKFMKQLKENGKMYYFVKFLFPFSKVIQLNKESLKLDSNINEGRKFWFLTHIKLQIEYQKHNGCNLLYKEIKEKLNYHNADESKNRKKILELLKIYKQNGFIHWFEINKDVYKIW